MNKATCLRCGRELRSAQSIRDGRGRHCKKLVQAAIRTADLGDYSAEQIGKACEAIEQGCVIPTGRPRLWTTVSSDGTTTYLHAIEACTCPAGRKQRRCYHRAAATILSAAQPARRAA